MDILSLPSIMGYNDLRPYIKDGDYGFCKGTQAMSKAIEFFTGNESHVFKFRWFGDGLFCCEEWEGVGFQIVPVSQKLQYYWDMDPAGTVKLGVAPKIVRDNPEGGNKWLETYRIDKKLQPYGGAKTFAEIMVSRRLGVHIDPLQVQTVCSTLAQQYDEKCGYGPYAELYAPADFEANHVPQKVILIMP